MAYPPTLPVVTRVDATTAPTNHPDDHNTDRNGLIDVVAELGSAPKGTAASVMARLDAFDTAAIEHLDRAHNRAKDTFTRADNATSMGSLETRLLTWGVNTGGVWGISSNKGYKPSAGYGIAFFSADFNNITEATVTFAAGDEFWIMVRLGASAAGGIRFGRRSANTLYTLENAQTGGDESGGATFGTAQTGDTIRIINRSNDGLAAEITRAGVTTRYCDTGTTTFNTPATYDKVGIAANGAGSVRFDNFSSFTI